MLPALGSVKEASEAVENEDAVLGFEGDLLAVVEERAVRWGEVAIAVMALVGVRVAEGGFRIVKCCGGLDSV